MSNFKNFVFCLFFLVAVEAQRCIPGIVPDMAITSDNKIQWTAARNPANCNITAYVINIFDLEEGSQLQYQTGPDVLSYSLENLDMCKTYTFEVHALTDQDVIGPSDQLDGTIPAATNLNLTLSLNNVILSKGQLTLTWNMLNTAIDRCISYYRVVYWDENNSPVDVYVNNNSFTLSQTPVPCMEYHFQVSAIMDTPDTEGPLAAISYSGYTAVPKPPKLVNIVTTNTTVIMLWGVPTYSENRCKLTDLVVTTLGLPDSNSTIIPIKDTPLRPNVHVILRDLIPNFVYTSYVSLQNVAGSSKNVTAMFQTSDSFVFNYETDLIYY